MNKKLYHLSENSARVGWKLVQGLIEGKGGLETIERVDLYWYCYDETIERVDLYWYCYDETIVRVDLY